MMFTLPFLQQRPQAPMPGSTLPCPSQLFQEWHLAGLWKMPTAYLLCLFSSLCALDWRWTSLSMLSVAFGYSYLPSPFIYRFVFSPLSRFHSRFLFYLVFLPTFYLYLMSYIVSFISNTYYTFLPFFFLFHPHCIFLALRSTKHYTFFISH